MMKVLAANIEDVMREAAARWTLVAYFFLSTIFIIIFASAVNLDIDDGALAGAKLFRKEVDIQKLFAGNAADDITVQSGDTVFVAKAPMFYLSGEAKTPGNYRVERGMTVQQAIAAGGGITNRGSMNRVRITRTGPDGRQVTVEPRLTDVVQAGDVVVVRESIF